MHPFGLLLIVSSLLIPVCWFLPLTSTYDNIIIFSQYLGAFALISMSWTQLLATRFTASEWIFGGLDRIYILHKWLGISAIAAVILHNTLEPEIDTLSETWLSELGSSLGGTSLDFLQILIVITLITIIPYRTWFFSHKFMGLLYILSSLHYWLVPLPFSRIEPLGIYISVFCITGIMSYLYLLLPLHLFKRYIVYKLVNIEETENSYSLMLEPVNKYLRHRAGQFAFIRFSSKNFNQSHPFTISQAPNEQHTLRFSIKKSGEYTTHLLNNIHIGSTAKIDGPYGKFTLAEKKKEQLWIGAGIGITPFLACAQALPQRLKYPIHIFYCVSKKSEAIHLNELEELSNRIEGLKLHLIESSSMGRLTMAYIEANTSTHWKKVHVGFCGPKAMRQALFKDFRIKGVSKFRLHYEEFEIRSGIGITKYAISGLNFLKEKNPLVNSGLGFLKKYSHKLLNRLPAWLQ